MGGVMKRLAAVLAIFFLVSVNVLSGFAQANPYTVNALLWGGADNPVVDTNVYYYFYNGGAVQTGSDIVQFVIVPDPVPQTPSRVLADFAASFGDHGNNAQWEAIWSDVRDRWEVTWDWTANGDDVGMGAHEVPIWLDVDDNGQISDPPDQQIGTFVVVNVNPLDLGIGLGGATTNWRTGIPDFTVALNLVFEMLGPAPLGRVTFTGVINLCDPNTIAGLIQLQNALSIIASEITLDITLLAAFNVPATLVMFDLPFTQFPGIVYNGPGGAEVVVSPGVGVILDGTKVGAVNWDPNTRTLTFTVFGWSGYKAYQIAKPTTGGGSGGNNPPVAHAGPDQTASVGEKVILDGGRSHDPDDGTPDTTPSASISPTSSYQNRAGLTFRWSFAAEYYAAGLPILAIPQGSLAVHSLEGSDSEHASFVPDLPGEYVLNLSVTDDFGATLTDQVRITAVDPVQAHRFFDSGWQLMSLPLQPVLPDAKMLTTSLGHVDVLSYASGYHPAHTMLPQGGYWVDFPTSQEVSVLGRVVEEDVFIDLPSAGWWLIGTPFAVRWRDVDIEDGEGHTYPLQQAVESGILGSECIFYSSSADGYLSSDYLLPWEGYWVRTYVDGIRLCLLVRDAVPGGEYKRVSASIQGASPPSPPGGAVMEATCLAYPNPVRHSSVTFHASGTIGVESIRASIYTSSGALVWSEEAVGSTVVWHEPRSPSGERLPWGVYIYRIDLLVAGQWIPGVVGPLFFAEVD